MTGNVTAVAYLGGVNHATALFVGERGGKEEQRGVSLAEGAQPQGARREESGGIDPDEKFTGNLTQRLLVH